MRYTVSIAGIVLAALGTTVSAQPVVEEHFNTGINGWTIYADATAFAWDASLGNPGGCLKATDQVTGVLWGFAAPAPFLGDKSCYYGGTIAWDVRTTLTASGYAVRPDLILESSNGMKLMWDVPGNPPANTWESESATLAETGWHVNTITGRVPTQAEFRTVLATLVSMRFNCEWHSGRDTGYIDNVVLTPGAECAPPCDADLNQDGNTDQADLDYLINVVAGGSNPTGIDPDFNHDGNADQTDLDALVNVIAGGDCP